MCGVSVGITETVEELRAQVDDYLAESYRRIKLKIAPGLDVDRVAPIRADHPDILLSVDANAAYTLDDLDVFRALDDLELLMIEQPLHHEDLLQHAKLQAQIRTDLCLDESIRSAADAAAALELGACRIVNIKQGRVGGVLEARAVHDVCLGAGVPVWCGGMLETGIGRATNLALAAMPGFTLPNDTSASARYFPEDLTEPFVLGSDGTMEVPDGPGIGVVPLYFAKPRPVVQRGGVWIMVDDDRLPLEPGETPDLRQVRFRTLGCYPLSGAIESDAATVSDIVAELRQASRSERQGRLIDSDSEASMERKKREGYF